MKDVRSDLLDSIKDVKSMQRPGTEAIRTQIQLSKPKREITRITNNQNTKRTDGQPSELFPKSWPQSNPNRTNIIYYETKVKQFSLDLQNAN